MRITMTDTNTTTAATADIEQQLITGALEHLPPGELELDTNVRDDAALDSDFVASIREHGVLQPVTAFRTPDGVVKVRDGQRRVLWAIQAALTTIPVYVRAAAHTDERAAAAERIVHQIVTNDHRTALTDAQRAKGINQMLLDGISVTKVAKKLAVRRETIDAAAATAATSAVAMAALDSGQLGLHEAAALTEFDDDQKATEALLKVAGTKMFDHQLAQLRQQRIDDAAYAEAAAHYQAQGYTILDERPQWRDRSRVGLRHLRTADGDIASEEHVTNPAHWAILLVEGEILVDKATLEPVDDADVDWNTEDNPASEPAEGFRHADSVLERTVYRTEFYCVDTEAAGLALAPFLLEQRPIVHNPLGGDPHDDQAAQAAREDAQRRERRKVLTLNKLGLAAEEVRRRFVKELLSRTTAPKGSAVFIATCLANSPNLPVDYKGLQIINDLLGLRGDTLKQAVADLHTGSDARARDCGFIGVSGLTR
jgi:ParB family transcriptional regulator, chromosome partitioning protein